jgi:RNA polymerase sigma-70 factor (ECF subfamily)
VKAWASTILRNTFINGYHRQARAAQYLSDLSRFAEQVVDCEPEQAIGSTDVLGSIMVAIAELPSEYRTAVTLADIDGLSYQEIADAMECPIGTVMSRIHRGRKALRKVLAGEAIEFGLRLAA